MADDNVTGFMPRVPLECRGVLRIGSTQNVQPSVPFIGASWWVYTRLVDVDQLRVLSIRDRGLVLREGPAIFVEHVGLPPASTPIVIPFIIGLTRSAEVPLEGIKFTRP
jgi:hypothetical protein